jgi:menaquinone-dependent protoporphyrinogen oxidase
MDVLVLYATAHGSTQGIAERVADRLRDRGHDAVARPADATAVIGRAHAVVLGSTVHHGQWLADAGDLLRRHTNELRDRPVWLFTVSSLGEGSSFFGPRVSRALRRERDAHLPPAQRERLAAVAPVDHHDFAGAVEADHWGLTGTLALYALGGHLGDHRNWDEVDAWADAIADHLATLPEPHDPADQEAAGEASSAGEPALGAR